MSAPVFEERFVAFIDILGFKEMVERSEAGDGRSVADLIGLMTDLGTPETRVEMVEHGPSICPMSDRMTPHAGFEITQASDCAVVSTEVSPAGAIVLIDHCWRSAVALLRKGVLIRGYITRGTVHHRGSVFLGTGYQSAYKREQGVAAFRLEGDEIGTPFIEIDPVVQAYIRTAFDDCVRKQADRMTKSDGDVMAIYPFKHLSHDFAVAGRGVVFNADREKVSNAVMRDRIRGYRDAILASNATASEKVARKVRHYVAALDAQIAQADRTDEVIDSWAGPAAPSWPRG